MVMATQHSLRETQLDIDLLGTANKKGKVSQERRDIADSEKEQIRTLATQIKIQRGEIRHFQRILDEGIWTIENKNPPKPMTWGVPENNQRTKPRRKMVRQREEMLRKLRNGLELSKMDKKKHRNLRFHTGFRKPAEHVKI